MCDVLIEPLALLQVNSETFSKSSNCSEPQTLLSCEDFCCTVRFLNPCEALHGSDWFSPSVGEKNGALPSTGAD